MAAVRKTLVLTSVIMVLLISCKEKGDDMRIEFLKDSGDSWVSAFLIINQDSVLIGGFLRDISDMRGTGSLDDSTLDLYKSAQFKELIDLQLPNLSGAVLGVFACAKDYSINNRGESIEFYYVYYILGRSNNTFVLRESWHSNLNEKSKLLDRRILYPKIHSLDWGAPDEVHNAVYKREMTYAWCECGDETCMSVFIDEDGYGYDFGYIQDYITEYSFQCYPDYVETANGQEMVYDTLAGFIFDMEFTIKKYEMNPDGSDCSGCTYPELIGITMKGPKE